MTVQWFLIKSVNSETFIAITPTIICDFLADPSDEKNDDDIVRSLLTVGERRS
jgi:hypothetical protein